MDILQIERTKPRELESEAFPVLVAEILLGYVDEEGLGRREGLDPRSAFANHRIHVEWDAADELVARCYCLATWQSEACFVWPFGRMKLAWARLVALIRARGCVSAWQAVVVHACRRRVSTRGPAACFEPPSQRGCELCPAFHRVRCQCCGHKEVDGAMAWLEKRPPLGRVVATVEPRLPVAVVWRAPRTTHRWYTLDKVDRWPWAWSEAHLKWQQHIRPFAIRRRVGTQFPDRLRGVETLTHRHRDHESSPTPSAHTSSGLLIDGRTYVADDVLVSQRNNVLRHYIRILPPRADLVSALCTCLSAR